MTQPTETNIKEDIEDKDGIAFEEHLCPKVVYQDDDVFCLHILKGGFTTTGKVPVRDMFCFLGCHTGHIDVHLYSSTLSAKANDVVFLYPNVMLKQMVFDDDYSGFMLGFSNRLMSEMLRHDRIIMKIIFKLYADKIIRLDTISSELMFAYGNLLDIKLKNSHVYIKETIHSLIKSVIYDLFAQIRGELTDIDEIKDKTLSRGDLLFMNFCEILLEDNRNERNVKYYADRLYVTPKYLSSVCHSLSGKTATQLINSVMTERIKYLLEYSDLTIKEISQQLDFPCLSFFGKFVKKHLGMSPKKYRALSDKD